MIRQQKKLETEIATLEMNGYQRNIDAIEEKRTALQIYRAKIIENGKFDIRILGPEIVKLLELIENESFIFGIDDVVARGYYSGQAGWPGYEADRYYSVAGITKKKEQLPKDDDGKIKTQGSIDTAFSQYQVGIDYVNYNYCEGLGERCYKKNFAGHRGIIIHQEENARGIRSNIGYIRDFVDFLIEKKIDLNKSVLSEEDYTKALTDFTNCRRAELKELSLRKIYL